MVQRLGILRIRLYFRDEYLVHSSWLRSLGRAPRHSPPVVAPDLFLQAAEKDDSSVIVSTFRYTSLFRQPNAISQQRFTTNPSIRKSLFEFYGDFRSVVYIFPLSLLDTITSAIQDFTAAVDTIPLGGSALLHPPGNLIEERATN